MLQWARIGGWATATASINTRPIADVRRMNAASPANGTLQAQGSRPATDSNVSGANLTIASGTSTPSTITFQVPVETGSGTGPQIMTTALTLNGVAESPVRCRRRWQVHSKPTWSAITAAPADDVRHHSPAMHGFGRTLQRWHRCYRAPQHALDVATALRPITFHYRPEPDLGSEQHLGLLAEDVAAVDLSLVIYDKGGRPLLRQVL